MVDCSGSGNQHEASAWSFDTRSDAERRQAGSNVVEGSFEEVRVSEVYDPLPPVPLVPLPPPINHPREQSFASAQYPPSAGISQQHEITYDQPQRTEFTHLPYPYPPSISYGTPDFPPCTANTQDLYDYPRPPGCLPQPTPNLPLSHWRLPSQPELRHQDSLPSLAYSASDGYSSNDISWPSTPLSFAQSDQSSPAFLAQPLYPPPPEGIRTEQAAFGEAIGCAFIPESFEVNQAEQDDIAQGCEKVNEYGTGIRPGDIPNIQIDREPSLASPPPLQVTSTAPVTAPTASTGLATARAAASRAVPRTRTRRSSSSPPAKRKDIEVAGPALADDDCGRECADEERSTQEKGRKPKTRKQRKPAEKDARPPDLLNNQSAQHQHHSKPCAAAAPFDHSEPLFAFGQSPLDVIEAQAAPASCLFAHPLLASPGSSMFVLPHSSLPVATPLSPIAEGSSGDGAGKTGPAPGFHYAGTDRRLEGSTGGVGVDDGEIDFPLRSPVAQPIQMRRLSHPVTDLEDGIAYDDFSPSTETGTMAQAQQSPDAYLGYAPPLHGFDTFAQAPDVDHLATPSHPPLFPFPPFPADCSYSSNLSYGPDILARAPSPTESFRATFVRHLPQSSQDLPLGLSNSLNVRTTAAASTPSAQGDLSSGFCDGAHGVAAGEAEASSNVPKKAKKVRQEEGEAGGLDELHAEGDQMANALQLQAVSEMLAAAPSSVQGAREG
ncbi:hypothetical protein JCM11641_002623 [Rhodosporidiobolus odoratus]